MSKYDIAISFAEGDRPIAVGIYEALKTKGVQCYYYASEKSAAWGSDIEAVMKRTYQYDSAYVLVLMSVNYCRANWTQTELAAALEREKYFADSILPVSIDDTTTRDIPGMNPNTQHLKYEHNPAEIAAEICTRIGFKWQPDAPGKSAESEQRLGNIISGSPITGSTVIQGNNNKVENK